MDGGEKRSRTQAEMRETRGCEKAGATKGEDGTKGGWVVRKTGKGKRKRDKDRVRVGCGKPNNEGGRKYVAGRERNAAMEAETGSVNEDRRGFVMNRKTEEESGKTRGFRGKCFFIAVSKGNGGERGAGE